MSSRCCAALFCAVSFPGTLTVVSREQIATRETKQRLAAAKNLPQLSQRCLDTIQQIEGIVKNVPGDDSTKVTLAGIQRDLETLGTLVEEVEELRLTESAGCCAKFAKGGKAKRKEAELLATDERWLIPPCTSTCCVIPDL